MGHQGPATQPVNQGVGSHMKVGREDVDRL